MDLMNLTPVQATLIATVVTTVVTTSTVAGTHLLTRARERRHLIWNRRMDAYGAAVQSCVALARMRQEIAARVDRGSDNDTVPDMTALGLVGAQVEMFGSRQVADLWNQFFDAVHSWTYALDLVEGRIRVVVVATDSFGLTSAPLPPIPEPSAEEKQEANLRRLDAAGERATAADARLLQAIKREARFQRPR
ncbi:hypothetical protein ABZZ17_19345 [Streptomyces sp. NPDC006512]|uniref:hypothetical protein n=1 Tax=Streptomyces sp. NPDC006512 TaxID=3154307 RepID=UPI0033B86886